MKPEYALSGYAEWFWLMGKNWKDVENRSWRLPSKLRHLLPLRIYLHASKTKAPKEDIEFILSNLDVHQKILFQSCHWDFYRGSIIGEITITGQTVRVSSSAFEGFDGFHSKWFFGPFGFIVNNGVLYDNPIPRKGALGFFKSNIP